MRPFRIVACVLAVVAFVSGVTGCFESPLTAAAKIANGQISQLSANEIKMLNQAAIAVGAAQNPPVTVPTLTDAQAAALASFFAVNSIEEIEDFQEIVAAVESGQSVPGLAELAAAFAGGTLGGSGEIDGATLTQIFNQGLGGSAG
jgi:hypothetical protein